ncbi:MAG: hypothetical protein ABSH28_04650 [Acidobacteriota bacterium]|jgi:hypothetical protein
MTNREIGRLSCRVLSIYTLTGFIGSLAMPVSMLQPVMWRPGSTTTWLLTLVPPLLLLLLGAFLWFGAEALGARMILSSESSESTSGATPQVIQRIAFAVAGILILVGAISSLRLFIQQIAIRISHSRSPMDNLDLTMLGVEVGIRFALGAWLLVPDSVRLLVQKAKPLVQKDW